MIKDLKIQFSFDLIQYTTIWFNTTQLIWFYLLGKAISVSSELFPLSPIIFWMLLLDKVVSVHSFDREAAACSGINEKHMDCTLFALKINS